MKLDVEENNIKNEQKERIKKLIKNTVYILLIVLLYNIFLISASSLNQAQGKDIFGYKAYIITTESMKPNINVGDVVLITKLPEENINVEDIITYVSGNETITHRVSKIIEQDGKKVYITKGDNNNIEDSRRSII